MLLFPLPNPDTRPDSVFRAPRAWERNTRGASLIAIATAILFLALALTEISLAGSLRWFPIFLILDVVVGVPLIFPPGNLIAMFPYAAQIDEGKGVWFYAPFNRFYVPLGEFKGIAWSYLRTGWVVRLKRRRGLVGSFVIHVAWGNRGRALVQTIEAEIARQQ